MAGPTAQKRQKELKRKERSDAKAQEREQRRAEKAIRPRDGDDPDLVGIVPGPQPIPDA